MIVYLLRHGPAEDRDPRRYPDDSERPLTSSGRKRTKTLARGMRKMDVAVDRVWASPFRRARETAQIVHAILRLKRPLELLESLAPGQGSQKAIQALGQPRRRQEILLVGHEPDLSQLASQLLVRNKTLRLILKKGGLCRIRLEPGGPRPKAVLEWLLTPDQLEKMG